jgi:RimJ/RimL family protein N-acetyltransferase
VLRAEAARINQIHKKNEAKQETERYNEFQDDNFFFIAGHTSGGAPYGVQWWEMGLEPWEDINGNVDGDGDEILFEYRHYDFLKKREKDSIDSRLREDFSKYVSKNRRLPSKGKRQQMIEKVFETCPGGALIYDKDFNSIYGKLVRKRENKFIQQGVLPKRFTPTEIEKYFERSVMLESERLIFRKITQDDFADLAVMLRDPDVMSAWEHTFSDEQIQKWIDNQIARYKKEIVGYFAAVRKDTGEVVGQMGLMWSDFDELRALEVGYMLKREYWNIGYAAEGAAALIQYGFTEIGLNKIYASIRPENTPSIRVAERIGMSAEGSFIKQYNGKDMEHIIYAKNRDCEID